MFTPNTVNAMNSNSSLATLSQQGTVAIATLRHAFSSNSNSSSISELNSNISKYYDTPISSTHLSIPSFPLRNITRWFIKKGFVDNSATYGEAIEAIKPGEEMAHIAATEIAEAIGWTVLPAKTINAPEIVNNEGMIVGVREAINEARRLVEMIERAPLNIAERAPMDREERGENSTEAYAENCTAYAENCTAYAETFSNNPSSNIPSSNIPSLTLSKLTSAISTAQHWFDLTIPSLARYKSAGMPVVAKDLSISVDPDFWASNAALHSTNGEVNEFLRINPTLEYKAMRDEYLEGNIEYVIPSYTRDAEAVQKILSTWVAKIKDGDDSFFRFKTAEKVDGLRRAWLKELWNEEYISRDGSYNSSNIIAPSWREIERAVNECPWSWDLKLSFLLPLYEARYFDYEELKRLIADKIIIPTEKCRDREGKIDTEAIERTNIILNYGIATAIAKRDAGVKELRGKMSPFYTQYRQVNNNNNNSKSNAKNGNAYSSAANSYANSYGGSVTPVQNIPVTVYTNTHELISLKATSIFAACQLRAWNGKMSKEQFETFATYTVNGLSTIQRRKNTAGRYFYWWGDTEGNNLYTKLTGDSKKDTEILKDTEFYKDLVMFAREYFKKNTNLTAGLIESLNLNNLNNLNNNVTENTTQLVYVAELKYTDSDKLGVVVTWDCENNENSANSADITVTGAKPSFIGYNLWGEAVMEVIREIIAEKESERESQRESQREGQRENKIKGQKIETQRETQKVETQSETQRETPYETQSIKNALGRSVEALFEDVPWDTL